MTTQTERSHHGVSDFLDKAALMEHVDGDYELLKEIVELFLETTPRLLSDIRDAITRADGKGLRIAAHALRGAARNFYAPSVEQAALVLEQMGENNLFHGAAAACASLQTELDTLRPLLLALVQHQEA